MALTIGEASLASGLPADTIRYYERTGVLPRVGREINRYRAYSEQHVETLRFARRLRDLGCSPAEMSSLVRIFHDGSCREMRDALLLAAGGLVSRVRDQLRELARAEAQLVVLTSALQALEPDDHRLLSIDPCGCVALVEDERPRASEGTKAGGCGENL